MAPAFTEQKMRMAGKLLAARKRAGMSQERAAGLVGTSRRHWIRWESGETMPNPLYLERVAEVLAAPELIDGDDEDEEPEPMAFGVAMQAMFQSAVDAAVDRKLSTLEHPKAPA